MNHPPEVVIGSRPLQLEDVVDLAQGRKRPVLAPEVFEHMQASYDLTQRRLATGQRIYGVTTGYGNSVSTIVPPAASAELSLNLLRFHGCGTGRMLDAEEAAAVLAVRLCSLSVGKSGVRPEIAERLRVLLERRILPAIPAEGSVGASGDLTPLSYVAALLVGEREVLGPNGGLRPASEVLAENGLTPLTLGPKEALALMNGTSVATALGALAYARSERLVRLAARSTALACRAINGNAEHFDALLHAAKGHPGQQTVARWIREELESFGPAHTAARLQDRYSIRCAPQVLGVVVDALAWFRGVLTTEINGVSDNPIVDAEHEVILHGGNFYGGHIGFVMDALKVAIANIADLLDRQLVVLCLPRESDGLADNLVGVEGEAACTHHGFKAMSISASALTAEALKLTIPASVFSRSTEAHNQDKVPMATIASRDALRVLELTEQVAAIVLLGASQAVDLRAPNAHHGALHAALRKHIPKVTNDRRMDFDITRVLGLLRSGALSPERGAQERDARERGSQERGDA